MPSSYTARSNHGVPNQHVLWIEVGISECLLCCCYISCDNLFQVPECILEPSAKHLPSCTSRLSFLIVCDCVMLLVTAAELFVICLIHRLIYCSGPSFLLFVLFINFHCTFRSSLCMRSQMRMRKLEPQIEISPVGTWCSAPWSGMGVFGLLV